MAILAKCAKCKRLGGYAEKAEDKLCFRCKKKSDSRDVNAGGGAPGGGGGGAGGGGS